MSELRCSEKVINQERLSFAIYCNLNVWVHLHVPQVKDMWAGERRGCKLFQTELNRGWCSSSSSLPFSILSWRQLRPACLYWTHRDYTDIDSGRDSKQADYLFKQGATVTSNNYKIMIIGCILSVWVWDCYYLASDFLGLDTHFFSADKLND